MALSGPDDVALALTSAVKAPILCADSALSKQADLWPAPAGAAGAAEDDDGDLEVVEAPASEAAGALHQACTCSTSIRSNPLPSL